MISPGPFVHVDRIRGCNLLQLRDRVTSERGVGIDDVRLQREHRLQIRIADYAKLGRAFKTVGHMR
ncbi:hypothetical protein D3C71_1758590 [compost metagenome]